MVRDPCVHRHGSRQHAVARQSLPRGRSLPLRPRTSRRSLAERRLKLPVTTRTEAATRRSGPALPLMDPTDTAGEFFHRVVDCQWACPAHTDVPEYIRLIAQGRFDDAYMLNRESNVFPGILGRVCDRPCEPACRRGRVEDKPVAICRLKRVAADNCGDISARLPKAPREKNGKRVALVGAGCASLTVANDLAPLGYECVIFEALDRPGGLMRTNIPAFRLPAEVLDEEIDNILEIGVDLKLSSPVKSLRALLDEQFDAVFIGSGAPKGKNLKLPGRDASDRIHIGIDWLGSIAFEHIDVDRRARADHRRRQHRDGLLPQLAAARCEGREGHRAQAAQLLQGVGLGARGRRRGARRDRRQSLAEGVRDRGRQARRHEVRRARVRARRGRRDRRAEACCARCSCRATTSCSRSARRTRSPGSSAISASRSTSTTCPSSTPSRSNRRAPACSSAATRRSGRRTSSGPSSTATKPRSRSTSAARAAISSERMPRGVNLASAKMGIHEWSYSNGYDASARRIMPHVDLKSRFKKLDIEVELGFTAEQALTEVERCLNCDLQTVFTAPLCIECDACIDICPVDCLAIAPNGDQPAARGAAQGAAPEPGATLLRVRGAEANRARDAQRREPLRPLRAVRRALPDGRVGHAEVDGEDTVRRATTARQDKEQWQITRKAG